MIDIKNYKPEWTPVVTAPTGGTTVTRDALAPTIGQQFFNTDNGNMESYDGAAWGAQIVQLPPRQGAVGLAPTTHWRFNVTKASYYFGGIQWNTRVLYADALATVLPAPATSGYLQGATTATGATSPLVFNAATSQAYAKPTTAASPWSITLVYPTSFSAVSVNIPTDVGIGSGYPINFTLEASYDGGTTWGIIDTFVNTPQTGVTRALSVPAYPANPVAGQRFFNTSTGKDNRWDANLSQWIPIVTGPVWQVVNTSKTLAVGEEAFTDTTAAPITLTLPLSPNMGDSITVHDSTGTWATNAVTLARNGASIMKLLQDMTLTVANKTVTVVYNGTDWRVL